MGFTAPISKGSHKYVAIVSSSYQSMTTSCSRSPFSLVDSAAFDGTALRETGLALLIALIVLIACLAVKYTAVRRNALAVRFGSCVEWSFNCQSGFGNGGYGGGVMRVGGCS